MSVKHKSEPAGRECRNNDGGLLHNVSNLSK